MDEDLKGEKAGINPLILIVIIVFIFVMIFIVNWDYLTNPYYGYVKVENMTELLNCSGKCYMGN